MTEQPHAKSFRSGNSIAIRIPAALGVQAGKRFAISRMEDGKLVLDEIDEKPRYLDMSFVGKGCGLRPFTSEERIIHSRPSELEVKDESS